MPPARAVTAIMSAITIAQGTKIQRFAKGLNGRLQQCGSSFVGTEEQYGATLGFSARFRRNVVDLLIIVDGQIRFHAHGHQYGHRKGRFQSFWRWTGEADNIENKHRIANSRLGPAVVGSPEMCVALPKCASMDYNWIAFTGHLSL